MSVRARAEVGTVDEVLAPLAVAAFGCAAVGALAGAAMHDVTLALLGAAVAAGALVYLMAGELVDPLIVLLISLPLPGLLVGGGLRLVPAVPLTACVIAAWFLAWGPTRRPILYGRLPKGPLLLFAGAYLLAGAFSDHRIAAAREGANLVALLLLLVVATDTLARRPDRMRAIPGVISVIAALCGVLAVMEMVGIIPGRFPRLTGLNRAALGFGQPNGLGMFLAMATPLTVYAWRTSRRGVVRWIRCAAVLAVAGGLLATFSRGSWASVLLGSSVLVLLRAGRSMLRIWIAALLAGLVVNVLTGGAVWEAILGVGRDWSILQRLALMAAGFQLFLANPVIGVGPGGFAEEMERVQVLVPTLWDVQATPHNAYLQVAAEAGAIGLLAILVLLAVSAVAVLRWARRRDVSRDEKLLRHCVAWGLAVVAVEGMVEWPLSHGHGQMVVLLMAMAFAIPYDEPFDGAGSPDLAPEPAAMARQKETGAEGAP